MKTDSSLASAPSPTRAARAICLALVMIAIGCGRSNNDSGTGNSDFLTARSAPGTTSTAPSDPNASDEPSATRADLARANVDPPMTLPDLAQERYSAHLGGEIARLTPDEQSWQSERVAESVAGQLSRLADYITDPKTERVFPNGLATDNWQCDDLWPESALEFEDRSVRVRRWRATGAVAVGASTANRSPLEAIARFRVKCPPGSQLRAQLKVVHVDLSEGSASTRVLAEVYGWNDRQTVQCNMTWQCDWEDVSSTSPRLARIRLLDFEELSGLRSELEFDDVTASVLSGNRSFVEQIVPGLDEWRRRIDWRFGLEIVGPHGLAVGDVNGDGLDDLFVCEPGGLPNRLFVQQPDGTALDVSAEAGVDYLEPTHSALLLDLDNDGDQDLVFASGRYLVILANDGRGVFQQRHIHASDSVIRSMAAADYDGNSFVDIYVCGYFSRDGSADGVGLGRPVPYHDANNGVRNYLLANAGSFRFADVTDQVGLDQNNHRFSYASAWADYDLDGDPDLYVANDFGRNNLYRNDGGRFVDVAAQAGVEDISAGMSACWSDYDRDGWFDVYVGNMFSSAGNRVAYQRQFQPAASAAQRELFQRHARGNSLFRNAGDGTFQDVSIDAQVTMGRWAWSSNFVDINNDGWDDLLVANGMVTSAIDPGDL